MTYLVEDSNKRGRESEMVFESVLVMELNKFVELYEDAFVVLSVMSTSKSNRLRRFDFLGIDFIVKYQYLENVHHALFQVKSSGLGVCEFKERYSCYGDMVCVVNMSRWRSLDDLKQEIEEYVRWTLVHRIDLHASMRQLQVRSGVSDACKDFGRKQRAEYKQKMRKMVVRDDYIEADGDLADVICSLSEMRTIQNEIARLEMHLQEYMPQNSYLSEMGMCG